MSDIQNDVVYRSALAEIDAKLSSVRKGTPEGERLNDLIDSVADYEARHHDIGLPDPIAAIEVMMDQMGLTKRDLEPLMGSRGHVSDIMNRHRPLSLEMIRRINKHLSIPADILIQKYPLQARRSREPAVA